MGYYIGGGVELGYLSGLRCAEIAEDHLFFDIGCGEAVFVGFHCFVLCVGEPVLEVVAYEVEDLAVDTAAIRYNAIVTPLSDSVTDTTVANVVFVIEWDMV